MIRSVAFKSFVAFCAALAISYLLFSPAPVRPLARAVAPVVPAPPRAVQVSAPAAAPVAKKRTVTPAARRQELDQNLKPIEGGVVNQNPKMSHFFSNQYVEGTLHRAEHQFNAMVSWLPKAQEIRREDKVLSFSDFNHSARGALEQNGQFNRFVYANTYSETDEQMYVRPEGGVEHDIILKNRPQALDQSVSLAYSGYLKLGNGLTLWDEDVPITGSYTTKNGVKIKNMAGNTVFYLREPVAFDAAVTRVEGGLDKERQALPEFQQDLTECEYHFEFDEAGVKLAVVTPGEWLIDPERSYPVVIDPNLGPFGLADGNPPFYYEASLGSDTLVPAVSSGQLLETDGCNGGVPLPVGFKFVYYGTTYTSKDADHITYLYAYLKGFASWIKHADCGVANTKLPDVHVPNNAFYPYWDDLEIGPDDSAGNHSGIYWFVTDDPAPNRRLVIQWYRLHFIGQQDVNAVISFNLILYECDSHFEFIIGQTGEQDLGFASVGIEDGHGDHGIQYTFNDSLSKNFVPIDPGTALTFTKSLIANVKLATAGNLNGCTPNKICFTGTATQPASTCAINPLVPPSFAFHWIFGDGSEGFTAKVCHTFTVPGIYNVQIKVTNDQGSVFTLKPTVVTVCDRPRISVSAVPQGGTAPLVVTLTGKTSAPANPQRILILTAATVFIEKVGDPNAAVITPYLTITPALDKNHWFSIVLPPLDVGIYRVRVVYTGTDHGKATTGTGMVFIYVGSQTVADTLFIGESSFEIDWSKKLPPADGFLPNPFHDTLSFNGLMNLQGIQSPLDFIDKHVIVTLNGGKVLIDAPLDSTGHAEFNDPSTGVTSTFDFDFPSGGCSFQTTDDLAAVLGLTNITEQRLVSENIKIQIGTIYNSKGTVLTYNYLSTQNLIAEGGYHFGDTASQPRTKGAPPGSQVFGQTLLVSGAFMATGANFNLLGNNVFADINGIIARYGGDSFRPTAQTNVTVAIDNFSEVLNFTTSPKFKVKGKPPARTITYKRLKGLPNTGVAAMSLFSLGGTFRIKTNGIPAVQLGLNPALASQPVTLTLTLDPENGQVFKASTTFDVIKQSETQFSH